MFVKNKRKSGNVKWTSEIEREREFSNISLLKAIEERPNWEANLSQQKDDYHDSPRQRDQDKRELQ